VQPAFTNVTTTPVMTVGRPAPAKPTPAPPPPARRAYFDGD
jgi:hypothetical protein